MTADLDPDRKLALAYVPARTRPALDALWRLDVTFGAILAAGGDAMARRLKLAWWREALERLDREPAPAEPLLRALAAQVLPAGVTGAELAAMEEAWSLLLDDGPLSAAGLDGHAAARGGALFGLSARLLGDAEFPVREAGRTWALVDLARHTAGEEERRAAFAAAKMPAGQVWPRALRPLGMLAALARRDLRRGAEAPERPGSPARMLRMIRHRLTGN